MSVLRRSAFFRDFLPPCLVVSGRSVVRFPIPFVDTQSSLFLQDGFSLVLFLGTFLSFFFPMLLRREWSPNSVTIPHLLVNGAVLRGLSSSPPVDVVFQFQVPSEGGSTLGGVPLFLFFFRAQCDPCVSPGLFVPGEIASLRILDLYGFAALHVFF